MRLKSTAIFLVLIHVSFAQVSFPGMDLWFHPQTLAMAGGGECIQSLESDRFNPAVIRSDGRLFSIGIISYPGDIIAESVSILLPRKSRTISVSLRHFGYGIFEGKDNNNISTENYMSSDSWLSASSTLSDTSKIYATGLNAGIFISNLEKYQAVVLTMGLGILITLPNDLGKISATIQNGGMPIDHYTGVEENLPIRISFGGARKLAYLPLELALDAIYYPGENSTRAHLSGVVDFPYHFQLRLGTTSMKLNQQTTYGVMRDFFADTGFGLSYSFSEYSFDLGTYMYGNGGWASGLGFGLKF